MKAWVGADGFDTWRVTRIKDESWFTKNFVNVNNVKYPNVAVYIPASDMQYVAINRHHGMEFSVMVQFGFQEYENVDLETGYEFVEELDALCVQYPRLNQQADPFGVDIFKIWKIDFTNSEFDFNSGDDFYRTWIFNEIKVKLSRCDI